MLPRSKSRVEQHCFKGSRPGRINNSSSSSNNYNNNDSDNDSDSNSNNNNNNNNNNNKNNNNNNNSCVCGSWVGQEGHHGLVYRRAQGRSLRHHAINDIIWRALPRAGGPSTREPAGLFRTDGKRPDGATLIPWSAGKYLAWDATDLRWSTHAPHHTSRHRD